MTDDCWSGENSRTPSSPSHPFSLQIDTNLPLNTFFFFTLSPSFVQLTTICVLSEGAALKRESGGK